MDLKLTIEEEIKKKSFTLNQKVLQKDGLLLRIHHHTDENSQTLRFLYCCFNDSGNLLASSDRNGNLFLINLTVCKFWGLPLVNSCTFIQFSNFKSCDIIIGLKTCEILIVNYEIGVLTGKLLGHVNPPDNISFYGCAYGLTSSTTEAIIWDLQKIVRLKILALEENTILRHVSFIPNSNYIISLYSDDSINIWELGSFKIIRILEASMWKNIKIKNLTFSRDGSVMALSGLNPILAIYSIKAWKILKYVNLPENVKSIRSLKFISFSETAKPLLAILSGNGVIILFDIFENTIVSELRAPHEIIKFCHADYSIFLSCILCTGNIEIYDITMYVEKPQQVIALTKNKLKVKLQQKIPPKRIGELKEELDLTLNIEKLRSILKEYGEYPESYRTMIWEQLLQLPHNQEVYEGIFKYQVHSNFQDLNKDQATEARSFKSMKLLLDNLVTWCSFFNHVKYLPVFVYPFVKVFQNRPIVCFEAIATLILNWCQYWFEYFPLPPINILAIVENMLLEWDPQLIDYMNEFGVTSKEYAWSLLETAFSEVLPSQLWYILWDHILTNEPSFLICAVVAYNITQRINILTIKQSNKFEGFYHKQNPLDLRKFINKSYTIMDKTKNDIHPRRYLNMFTMLEKGSYPIFQGYPKVILENETQKLNDLQKEIQNIELEEAKLLLDKKKEIDRILDSDLENIEKKRLFEMKKVCNEKLQDEQIQAKQHLQRLSKLRKKFDDHQSKVIKYSKSDQLMKRLVATDMLCSEIDTYKKEDEYQAEKAETLLLRHYSELIKHKMQIEALLQEESNPIDEPYLHETIRREHRKILREIEKIAKSPDAEERIRQYNLISSLLAMDDLIKKVESALAKELTSEYLDLGKSESCLRNLQLQTETEELEAEVINILNALSKSRIDESKSKLSAEVSTNEQSNFSFRNMKKYQLEKNTSDSISTQIGTISSSSTQSCPLQKNMAKNKVKKWKKKSGNKSVRFTSTQNK